MSGRAKRDLCREICLTLKLQMETDSHRLLMERTESLGDGSHEQWVKLEKQHFDDWAGNCWIRRGAPWHEEGDRPHGGFGACTTMWSEPRRKPKRVVIRSRWVKTKEGDEVRCRFVAQEFTARNPRNDLFAGTPPLYFASDVHGRLLRVFSALIASGISALNSQNKIEKPIVTWLAS